MLFVYQAGNVSVNPSLWLAMFNMRSKTVFLVLLLLTLMLMLYWSSEVISDHIIRVGQLGKRYIYLLNAVKSVKRSFR